MTAQETLSKARDIIYQDKEDFKGQKNRLNEINDKWNQMDKKLKTIESDLSSLNFSFDNKTFIKEGTITFIKLPDEFIFSNGKLELKEIPKKKPSYYKPNYPKQEMDDMCIDEEIPY